MISLQRARRRLLSTASTATSQQPPVRVRYAPSPTGFLHLGGLRTALYNYLFARANDGTFILRIEDTDKSRQVAGSIEGLIRALKWCGVDYDEGPKINDSLDTIVGDHGAHGPYVQSQRLPTYHAHAYDLLTSGKAYRCFCTPQRLEAVREAQAKKGQPTLYDRTCAKLPAGEAERRAAAGEPHVIRMYVPSGQSHLADQVVGDVTFGHAVVDDQVLLKSDGFPTYHLASVVDDHLMGISHVIRGQEWLSSTPKHLLLYSAFGWKPPAFAHLPLLLNPDRSKLSKRHGDAAVEDFVAAGYTPEGLVNFVALLGWTPSSSSNSSGASVSEVMSLEEMVRSFRLSDVNKSNAIVDRGRLDFFNGEQIKRMLTAGSAGAAKPAAAAAKPVSVTLAPKGGKNQKQPQPQPVQPPAPLELEDSPSRARVRHAVAALIDAPLKALHAASLSSGSDGPAFVPSASRLSPERFNAILHAQKDRVATYSDFTALVLPFLATDAEFATLIADGLHGVLSSSRSSLSTVSSDDASIVGKLGVRDAAVRVYQHAHKPAAAGAKGDATAAYEAAAAVAPSTDEMRAYYCSLAPALRSIASSWRDETSDATFLQAPAAAVKSAAKAQGVPPGRLMLPLRFVLTGLDVGASLTDTMRLLGRQACVARTLAFADAAS